MEGGGEGGKIEGKGGCEGDSEGGEGRGEWEMFGWK